MDNFIISSLNVRGLRGNQRYSVFNWLKSKFIDICLIQETFCTPDFAKTFQKGWQGRIIHSFTNSHHSRGVAILLREGLQHEIISEFRDNEGRMILINLKIDNIDYSICNIYAPNEINSRILFLRTLCTFINTNALSLTNLMIGGDFNCIQHINDRISKTLDKSSYTLEQLKHNLSIIDIWREVHPNKVEYTYIDPSIRGTHSRIDFFLIHHSLIMNTLTCKIHAAPTPDHKAVILKVKLENRKRGMGYWKLNNSILSETNYKQMVLNTFNAVTNEYKDNVKYSLLWEYLKFRFKEETISYCIRKASVMRDKVVETESKLQEIDEEITLKNEDHLQTTRRQLKQTLDDIFKERSLGYQIRSRANWIEQGEKSTSYFLHLENKRQSNNIIYTLKDKNGIMYNTDTEILEHATTFYSTLFSSSPREDDAINNYFCNINHAYNIKLTDEARQSCEGAITITECSEAIKHMKNNKSPGLDGLSIEFYKTFWHLLGPILLEVYNESYTENALPESLRKSVISLLFKKGEKTNICNYRPISITNIDYKILAFVLTARLQNVIGNIVDSDQTAYIKNRFLGTNIKLVSDIIEYFDNFKKPGLLLLLDFEKAFDSIERNFLLKTLKWFGFGDSFIHWVKVIYTLPVAHIKITATYQAKLIYREE